MAELSDLPMDHPARAEVDRIFGDLPVYSEEDYHRMSRRDRYVWDVAWMDTASMNGGFDHWFSLMGHHAVETVEALAAIGAPNAHRVIQRVCELFPELPPLADEERVHAAYKEFFDRHGMIDDAIADDDEKKGIRDPDIELDLYQRLLDYWKNADPAEM